MITFSFRKTAHRCIVRVTQSNWVKKMWFSCFPVLPGSAEAHVIWGGIVKRLLIAYFIDNIFAKKYHNPFMCVKVIASHTWDVFLKHGVHAALLGTEVDLVLGHIVLAGVPSFRERGTAAHCFRPMDVYCDHGRPSQLLLSSCSFNVTY